LDKNTIFQKDADKKYFNCSAGDKMTMCCGRMGKKCDTKKTTERKAGGDFL